MALKCEGTMAKITKPKDRYIIIIMLVYDPDIFFITSQFIGFSITVTISNGKL